MHKLSGYAYLRGIGLSFWFCAENRPEFNAEDESGASTYSSDVESSDEDLDLNEDFETTTGSHPNNGVPNWKTSSDMLPLHPISASRKLSVSTANLLNPWKLLVRYFFIQ